MIWDETTPLSADNLNDLEDRITAALASVTTGKDDLYDALVAKDLTPASKDFADLVTAVNTVKRRASGTATAQVTDGKTRFIKVTGLSFKPSIVVTDREGPGFASVPGMIANGKNYYGSQTWDGVNPPINSVYTITAITAVGSFTCNVDRYDVGSPITGGQTVNWWAFE